MKAFELCPSLRYGYPGTEGVVKTSHGDSEAEIFPLLLKFAQYHPTSLQTSLQLLHLLDPDHAFSTYNNYCQLSGHCCM